MAERVAARPKMPLSLFARLAVAAFFCASCAASARERPLAASPEGTAAPAPGRQEAAPERWASARAVAHYLRARLAEDRGDFRGAAEELRGALAFDDESAQLHYALGEVLARMAQLGPAEAEIRRAIAGDPQGPVGADALALLGRIQAAQHRRDEAVESLRSAIRLEVALAEKRQGEEAAVDPEPWRILGEIYLEEGNEEQAARTYEELAARVPGDGSGFREMGRLYLEKRDLERAEKYLRRAVEKDPEDSDAWRRLAQLELTRRQPQEARKAYEAVLRVEGDDIDALLALGKLLLQGGDLAGARAYFGQLLRVAADDAGARLNVSLTWLEAHRADEALAVIEDGLRSGTDGARLKFVQGLALQEQRRWEEAARAYGAVGEGEGDLWGSARMNLAYCLSQGGKHAEAERVLEKAMASRPRDVRLVSMMAHVLERAGRSDDAVRFLERSVKERESAPNGSDSPAELYEVLAESLSKAGRVSEAIAVLKRALQQRPRDGGLLYALGASYQRAGDADAAVAQMRALLVVEPDHAEALNFVGYTYAERGVRLEEAEQLIARALELRPENGFFLDSLGWVYFRRGEFGKAVGALEKAEALSGPEPTILEHLGDAYRSAQRPADAAGAYRRALKTFDQGAEPERSDQRAAIERKLRELGTELRPAKR